MTEKSTLALQQTSWGEIPRSLLQHRLLSSLIIHEKHGNARVKDWFGYQIFVKNVLPAL